MQDLLQDLLTLAYVVASMLGMGLSLTPGEILRPLAHRWSVVMALVANFAVVPFVAWLLMGLVPDPSIRIGLVLMGTAAGSPFLLTLAHVARVDPAEAVGLLVLLVVGTVLYLPLALPWIFGIAVDPLPVGLRLAGQILLPLTLGLLARWRYPEGALDVVGGVKTVSNVSLVLLVLLMVLGNLPSLISLAGGAGIVVTLMVVGAAASAGWLMGGPGPRRRVTLALGTGQRNFAAAFVVANGAFASRPGVFVFLAAAAVLDLVLCFVLAGELGRRHREEAPPVGPELPA